MSGESIFFTIFALVACGGAVAVVLTQSVVRMAFWLVISLGSLAGLFFLLGAAIVWSYPITEEKQREIRAAIEARQQADSTPEASGASPAG